MASRLPISAPTPAYWPFRFGDNRGRAHAHERFGNRSEISAWAMSSLGRDQRSRTAEIELSSRISTRPGLTNPRCMGVSSTPPAFPWDRSLDREAASESALPASGVMFRQSRRGDGTLRWHFAPANEAFGDRGGPPPPPPPPVAWRSAAGEHTAEVPGRNWRNLPQRPKRNRTERHAFSDGRTVMKYLRYVASGMTPRRWDIASRACRSLRDCCAGRCRHRPGRRWKQPSRQCLARAMDARQIAARS